MSIVAIALTAVYRLHSQTLAMANATVFYATAPLLAQQKMVSLQLKPADELTDDSGDFGDDFTGYGWSTIIDEVESEFLENTAKDLKKIDVSVDLNNGEFVYDIRAYKFIVNIEN
jgi:general secretion pathway protein I